MKLNQISYRRLRKVLSEYAPGIDVLEHRRAVREFISLRVLLESSPIRFGDYQEYHLDDFVRLDDVQRVVKATAK